MKKEKGPRKKLKIPNIKIPSMNMMKLVLAVVMLVTEVVVIIGSSMYEFQAATVTFILFAIITFDYIRVIRAEMRAGPWYELEDMEA